MPIIHGIAIKYERAGPMTPVQVADISLEEGLIGDCKGSGGRSRARQITILSADQWQETCLELGISMIDLPWTTRRAGLCMREIRFSAKDAGRHLRIGKDVILEITGETTPCVVMDKLFPGLQAALTPDWRGGVTSRVIHGGRIRGGDAAIYL